MPKREQKNRALPGYDQPMEQELRGTQQEVDCAISILTENKDVQNSGDSQLVQEQEHLQKGIANLNVCQH